MRRTLRRWLYASYERIRHVHAEMAGKRQSIFQVPGPLGGCPGRYGARYEGNRGAARRDGVFSRWEWERVDEPVGWSEECIVLRAGPCWRQSWVEYGCLVSGSTMTGKILCSMGCPQCACFKVAWTRLRDEEGPCGNGHRVHGRRARWGRYVGAVCARILLTMTLVWCRQLPHTPAVPQWGGASASSRCGLPDERAGDRAGRNMYDLHTHHSIETYLYFIFYVRVCPQVRENMVLVWERESSSMRSWARALWSSWRLSSGPSIR